MTFGFSRARTAGYFGEIITSGTQIVGVFQRLAVLAAFNELQVIAGRSLRDIQFPGPVRRWSSSLPTPVRGPSGASQRTEAVVDR